MVDAWMPPTAACPSDLAWPLAPRWCAASPACPSWPGGHCHGLTAELQSGPPGRALPPQRSEAVGPSSLPSLPLGGRRLSRFLDLLIWGNRGVPAAGRGEGGFAAERDSHRRPSEMSWPRGNWELGRYGW
nr:unnamed protein product [Digitaria exilis]